MTMQLEKRSAPRHDHNNGGVDIHQATDDQEEQI